MIRPAEPKDIPEMMRLVLVILKDMELSLVKELGDTTMIKLLSEASFYPNYRYSYKRAIVKELEGQVAGVAFGYPAADEVVIDELLQQLLAEKSYEVDQKLFLDSEVFPNEWYLDSLVVSHRFRGQGIGSELLAYLPILAKESGQRRIGLNVDLANPQAEKLYVRHGFTYVGKKMISGHEYKHMQKTVLQ